MTNRDIDDPSDYPEPESPDQECWLHGHAFEENDTISQICSNCGLVREYAIKENQGIATARPDDIYTCRTLKDHVFGLNGKCIYCKMPSM